MTHLRLRIRTAWLMLATVGLMAGCRSAPPEPTPDAVAAAEAARHIRAVSPPDMAQNISRRPVFKWFLASTMTHPEQVTFKLFEIGQVDDPQKAEAQEQEVLLVTGLGSVSPTDLDLFNRPSGSIATGDLRDRKMTRLMPNTWYHWMIRAIDGTESTQASFYFRTGKEEAALLPATPAATPAPSQEPPGPVGPKEPS